MKTHHSVTIPMRKFVQNETASNPLNNEADPVDEENWDSGLFDMTCDVDSCTTVFTSLSNAKEHYLNVHFKRCGYIKCCDTNCRSLKLRSPADIKDHIVWHKNPECFKYILNLKCCCSQNYIKTINFN